MPGTSPTISARSSSCCPTCWVRRCRRSRSTTRRTRTRPKPPWSGRSSSRSLRGSRPAGTSPAAGAAGEPCWVEGTVTDTDGKPVSGARIEVWEADEDGFYDVQYGDDRPAARAHLFTDEKGGYRFWGVTPTPYPIPHDGPVGKLLRGAGRSPMRASHLHFLVIADGKRTLVTHIFVRGDEMLTRDAVFGVKESLVMDFEQQPPPTPTPDGRDLSGRTWSRVRFDIVLAPAGT